MSFASPLGLLALFAVPVVLALHLYRRRLAQRRVAGLFLFAPDRLVAEAGRKRTRLLRTASLWLELAAAVVLAAWLAEPVLDAGGAPPHLLFVLDDSASMAARTEDGTSAAERARAVVERSLDEAPRDARVTIVTTGRRPEVLCGPRAPVAGARASLAFWRPTRPGHDPGRALELARELGGHDADAFFLTDGADVEVGDGWTVLAFGRSLSNAGILHARRVGRQVLCDVALWADNPRPARVSVAADGSELAVREVELDPERPTRLAFDGLNAEGPVEVCVSMTDDGLALDDSRELLPQPLREVGLGVAMDDADAGRLGLTRAMRAVAGLVPSEDALRAPLRWTDQRAETAPWAGQVEVVVAPCGEDRDAWIGPYWIDRPYPLTEGMSLDGVVWTAGEAIPPGAPLVSVGAVTLMSVERFANDALRVHLNLAPGRQNLTSAPDWPILLQNLTVAARERLPGALEVHVAVGEDLRWRPSPEARGELSGLRLVVPNGETREGRGARVVAFEAREPGVHRLLANGEEVARFAVFFVDAEESDLRYGSTFTRPAAPARSEDGVIERPDGSDEARWLTIAILALVLADWWVLRQGGAA